MKKKKHGLSQFVSQLTELPPDAFSGLPVFTIRGGLEVEITGCRGVLEYDDNRVVLKTGEGCFIVLGKRLLLSEFRGDTLLVHGQIVSVSLREDTGVF